MKSTKAAIADHSAMLRRFKTCDINSHVLSPSSSSESGSGVSCPPPINKKASGTTSAEITNKHPHFLHRQRSFSGFEKERESSLKENNQPILGGSVRYTGKSTSASTFSSLIVPERGNNLNRQRNSEPQLISVKKKGKNIGVSNLLTSGLDLFKRKKSSTNCSSPFGHGGESGHKLKMHHNQLIQWRFVNAKASTATAHKTRKAEKTLLNLRNSLSNLRSSVVNKRIQFGKEKLELKINKVLQSQIEGLEAWGDMERQHVSTLSTTEDDLHSIVCKVPLFEGAQMDPQSTSVDLRLAENETTSIISTLADILPSAQKNADLLTQLEEVMKAEKTLLQECYDMIGIVSTLEAQERSLRCGLIQLKAQQQCQPRRQPPN